MLIDTSFVRKRIYLATEPIITGFPPIITGFQPSSNIFNALVYRYGNEPRYIIDKLIDQFNVAYKRSQRRLRTRLADNMEKSC